MPDTHKYDPKKPGPFGTLCGIEGDYMTNLWSQVTCDDCNKLNPRIKKEWQPQFVQRPNGEKVICTTCGREGSDLRGPDGQIASGYYRNRSWMSDCMKPHPFACICGRAFPKEHIRARHIRMMKASRKPMQQLTEHGVA